MSENVSRPASRIQCQPKNLFRNTLNKLVETADIISSLSKNTKSSSAKIKKPLPTQIMDRSQNKFKTGGIVVTAVQNRRKPKELNLNNVNIQTDTKDVEISKINFRKFRSRAGKERRIPTLNQWDYTIALFNSFSYFVIGLSFNKLIIQKRNSKMTFSWERRKTFFLENYRSIGSIFLFALKLVNWWTYGGIADA